MITSLYSFTFQNGKQYIGISSNIDNRFKMHKFMANSGNGYAVHNAIRKYGFDNVDKKILAIGNKDYILDLEIKSIKKFNTLYPHGYNISFGGEGGTPKSEIVREKIRQSKLIHWQNPEYRQKMIDKNSGRIMTPEQNKKNSDACKIKWQNSEYKASQILKMKGRKQSEESKNKRSISLKLAYVEGRRNSIADKMLGRKWINNGLEHKQILPNELIPDGWNRGMLKKVK